MTQWFVYLVMACVVAAQDTELPVPCAETTPRFGLSMIVKNEAAVIERSLSSIKPYLDYYVIVDTGSTDDTIAEIGQVMEGVPGVVVQRPWVNFAHNRNEALDLLRPVVDFAVFLDADDLFVADAAFPGKGFGLTRDTRAAWIPLQYGSLRYRRIGVVRTDTAYRWHGVVHEVLYDVTGTEPLDSIRTLDHCHIQVIGGGHRSQDPAKYLKDAKALEKYIEEHPQDTRAQFYLAQSYRDAGYNDKAIQAYEDRVTMGGWREEVFWSLYQLALVRNTDDAFARAARFAPWRVEPLYHRARLARERDDHTMALAMARLGFYKRRPDHLPSDTLFHDRDIYEYGILFELSVAAYYDRSHDEFEHWTNYLIYLNDSVPQPWRSYAHFNRRWFRDAPKPDYPQSMEAVDKSLEDVKRAKEAWKKTEQGKLHEEAVARILAHQDDKDKKEKPSTMQQ